MKKAFLLLLLSTISSLGVLCYVNYFVLNDSSVSNGTSSNTELNGKAEHVEKNIRIPKECSYLNFNNDGTKFAYISKDIAYISDFDGNDILVDENNFVSYVKFQSNDSVVYTVYKQSMLVVKKYNVTTGKNTDIAEISVNNLNSIRNVWCNGDNIVVELSVLNNAQRRTRVYAINSGIVNRLTINGDIEKGEIANNTFIYSNENKKVYVSGKEVSCFGTTEFGLLATDGNQKLFLCDAYDVNKIIGFKVDDTLSLTPNASLNIVDSSFAKTMYTDSLYLIYEDKAIDALNGLQYSVDSDSNILFVSKNTIVYENNGIIYLEKK